MKLTTDLHLALRSRIRGAIPPHPQYASMAWCSVKARGTIWPRYAKYSNHSDMYCM